MIKAGTPREAIGFSLHLLNSYQVGPISQRMQDECGCFPPAFTVRHGVFFQLLLKWSVRLKGGWVMYMINKWLTAYVVQREKTKQERVGYKSTWWVFFFFCVTHLSVSTNPDWYLLSIDACSSGGGIRQSVRACHVLNDTLTGWSGLSILLITRPGPFLPSP